MSRALTLVGVGIAWPLAFVLAERYAGRILRSRTIGLPSAIFLWATPLLIISSPFGFAALALARWQVGRPFTFWEACQLLSPFPFVILALFPGRDKVQRMYAPVLRLISPAEKGEAK